MSYRMLLAILPWLAMSHNSHGVIVAGTLGLGNNNNTQVGLDDYLTDDSLSPFPYWQNLVRVTNSSGVYLGFNPNTLRGWVLSANHVTTPTSITVAGNSYSVASGTRIGTSDLKLYEIGGGMSDPGLPSLATVPLASAFSNSGQFTLMFGRASTNDTNAPFDWVAPGISDANGMRWGTNTVEFGDYFLGSNRYIATNFSTGADPSVTAYEAQGASGDSGGGLFVFRDGAWELSGIAHFVDDGPDLLEQYDGFPSGNGPQTGDGVTNPSQFGDFTGYSDVFASLSSIQSFTGTLIPEPSSLWLVLSGACLLCRRHR